MNLMKNISLEFKQKSYKTNNYWAINLLLNFKKKPYHLLQSNLINRSVFLNNNLFNSHFTDNNYKKLLKWDSLSSLKSTLNVESKKTLHYNRILVYTPTVLLGKNKLKVKGKKPTNDKIIYNIKLFLANPVNNLNSYKLPRLDWYDLINVQYLRKETLYTKLKYSRSPAYDSVSGGAAALLAGFIGFLISEKFGFELVDSGDFYFLTMYIVFLIFFIRPLIITISPKNPLQNLFSIKNFVYFYLNLLTLIFITFFK